MAVDLVQGAYEGEVQSALIDEAGATVGEEPGFPDDTGRSSKAMRPQPSQIIQKHTTSRKHVLPDARSTPVLIEAIKNSSQ